MKKHLLALPVVLLILAVTAFGVFANVETPTATVEIIGGSLNITADAIPFEDFQLTGHYGTATSLAANNTWEATDPTGTGDGWRLTIESTDFTNTEDATKKVFIADEFKIELLQSDVDCVDGNDDPVSQATAAQNIPHADDSTPFAFLVAGTDTGMGTYNLNPKFTLGVPADTYAGTYTATVTVTIVSGPGS